MCYQVLELGHCDPDGLWPPVELVDRGAEFKVLAQAERPLELCLGLFYSERK